MSRHEPPDYRRVLEATLGIPFTDGNRIERLVNGEAIFPAMLEAIAQARSTIDFLTFVYWQGDIAEKIGQALAERARAGLRVRVLLDAFGAHSMPEQVVESLRSAGAEVQWFRPKARPDYVPSSAALSCCSVQGRVVAAARNSLGKIERRL